MKYVFVDSDAGGTPTNATPDTSTSKYHTTSGWPSSGATWSTLSAPEADADIAAITDDVTIYCRGATDVGGVVFAGWSAASITVIGDANAPTWDASKFTIAVSGSTQAGLYFNGTQNFTAKNLQIINTGTNAGPYGIRTAAASGSPSVLFDSCYVRIGGSGTSTGYGIRVSGGAGTVEAKNCIVVIEGSPGGARDGIGLAVGITGRAINCVVKGMNIGIAADVATNCAVFDCTDDFSGGTISYCASDDGDGTNAQTSVTWANEFVDYVNGDFTLKSGGTKLQGTGIGPSSDAAVPSTDIAGVTRSGTTTDIGAAMYVSTGLSITSVTPSAFDDGRTGIVIAGSGFGASQGSSTLTIGGQAQTVTAWSDTSITFTSVRGSNSMGARSLTLTRA